MTDDPNYDGAFDAIVVGAGLAGSAAALTMARRDLDVLVVERGTAPGTKNVFGGVMYTPTLRELVDVEDAPTERYVAEKRYGILSDDGDETAVTMRPQAWNDAPHNDSFTVIRRRFDEWFAEQAVDAGATLVTETTVTDLLEEDGRIVGVETDRPNGSIEAPVVVLAEGANSLVSEGAALKRTDDRKDVAVAVKEVRKLDRDTIEERFRLSGDAGAAYHYFGDGAVGDTVGGGYIYPNKRTISIGVAYRIEDATTRNRSPEDVLNEFKRHPAIAPLVRGGRMVEYSAHAIPEGGADAMPDLVHDGAVIAGDAAGMVLNNGLHLEGTNMAIESGYQAGDVVADAIERGRTNARALAPYEENVRNSFVVQNLEHYDFFHELIADDRDFLFEDLPRALADAQREYFRMDRTPKDEHASRAKSRMLDATGGWVGAAKRAWKYRKVLS
jgi:electron transfer flavoprotein-quinone oxidoreductase